MGKRKVERDLKSLQFGFDGTWMPGVDPALIGAKNFSVLENLRYIQGSVEGIGGYSKINTAAISATPRIRSGIHLKTPYDKSSYIFVHAQSANGKTGHVLVNETEVPEAGEFESEIVHTDATGFTDGSFSHAAGGHITYANGVETLITAGDEMRCAAVFTGTGSADGISFDDPAEYSDQMKNTLSDVNNLMPIKSGRRDWIVFTTRPIKSTKLTLASYNTTASTLTVRYWRNNSWDSVANLDDGTSSGGASLAQDGVISFDFTQYAEPYHFEEIYLYAYWFTVDDGNANIKSITINAPFQKVVDVWDGVLRQPMACHYSDGGEFSDYTLDVNTGSEVHTPIGAILDAMGTSDALYIGFEERTAAIRAEMLATLVNKNIANATISYWNGDSWVSVGTLRDGTKSTTKTLSQSGVWSWDPPPQNVEFPREMFGKHGWYYRLTVSTTLSGTAGGDPEILVDIITGIPAQQTVLPCRFTSRFNNRTMLCSFPAGREESRVDYSLTNAPDAYNGEDSSMHGIQSLYFGGNEKLTCATELYNRYGANIYGVWLVLKNNELYLLNGTGPEDFKIYTISYTIGCPAPRTLKTAEMGFSVAQDVERNIAIWLSYAGIMIFDGSVLKSVKGFEPYFDQDRDECINYDYIEEAWATYSPDKKEYTVHIPSGPNTTKCNIALTYNLLRQRGYKRNYGSSEVPQSGIVVQDDNGVQYTYAGLDTGHLVRLEHGKTWDGDSINYIVESGDFWPTDNMWDITLIRHVKLISKKFNEADVLAVELFINGENTRHRGLVWKDNGSMVWKDNGTMVWKDNGETPSMDMTGTTGDNARIIRQTTRTNQTGWAHRVHFEASMSETTKGFQPIGWGVLYEFIRTDKQ